MIHSELDGLFSVAAESLCKEAMLFGLERLGERGA